ncbi:hypothetical protein FRC04_011971 [Tulasnella sp. 424]|nr:hypothetical protein FRC04_011971 [Tulasnella sp. 424]KAG8971329.1 hypothetical protein FRC05_011321 [Tulasnella sp. 425]
MPQLPPVPPGFPVDLPNLPPSADPPVAADWTAIRVHQAAVLAARTTFGETNAVREALAECELYKVRLGIASSTPMIAAVVQPAAEQFTPMQLAQINGLLAPLTAQIGQVAAQIGQVTEQVGQVTAQVGQVTAQVGQLGEATAQVNNRLDEVRDSLQILCHHAMAGGVRRDNNDRADGHPEGYEPLQLVNGEWPEDVGLPDLQNAQSFRDLPQNALNAYIIGYGGLAAMNAQRHVKLNSLARHIGCTAVFGPAD